MDLKSHIAALKAKESTTVSKPIKDAILFWGTSADTAFLPHLKGCVGSATVYIRSEPVTVLTALTIYCHAKKINKVISTNVGLLSKLLHWDKRAAPSLANYAGSYFTIPSHDPDSPPIEIVFIQPLKQLITVSHGKSMATRLIGKLTKPEVWFKPTEFTGYDLVTASTEAALFYSLSTCSLVCIDIETFKENATIRCLAYTGFKLTPAGWESISCVLALDSEYALAIMRKWCWELKAPKIFQNGKYDIAYLTRYSAPVYNYLYDTAHLFHSWYSELPKDLGFLNSFFIREAVYWKDLAETNDLDEYYRYNALDTWGTGNCFLAMLLECPQYAIDNYLLEFPLVFPCHLSEMTGMARDLTSIEEARVKQQAIIDKHTASLNTMLAVPAGESFNVASPPQMKSLLKALGCSDLPDTSEKNLKKARFRHPLNGRILSLVIETRKARKLVSTYLTVGKEFIEPSGEATRILYALNPHGTDSSRLASKSHHFWCGINVQNIPRGPSVKQTIKADPGFAFAEVDLEQAESRDTGYISGDKQLIHNVEFSADFHSSNASCFFGVPFEKIFDVLTGKVLNKPLRQLAKPVNHGANYNMGAFTLVETMGEENLVLAKQLLQLPRYWTLLQVAEHLLEQFHKTYPSIKGVFYPGVVNEILTTRKLTSLAVHHEWKTPDAKLTVEEYTKALPVTPRWTRYCFGHPDKNKQDLNSYISHPPQSLNAQSLNKSYLTVFHDIAINEKHSTNFKLCAQIHDSILFQYRIGHEYLCDMVKERMEIPITIKAYDGVVRTFTVPAGIKRGQHLEGASKGRALYWSETE